MYVVNTSCTWYTVLPGMWCYTSAMGRKSIRERNRKGREKNKTKKDAKRETSKIYIKSKCCLDTYSLNKKEWICSLFKEWILEKSEIRVNLEWTFVLFTHFGVTSGITQGFRVIPEVTPKWVNNTNVHSKFTLISLFSKIHSLKSEHVHSFLFRE